MGKKNKEGANLGRSLIRERAHANRGRRHVSDQSMLHTTEVKDGYDWGRLNLQSVTEESSFQEFLSTAELAGTEFQAEKLNITFVNPKSNVGLLTHSEKLKCKEEQDKNKESLKIPRRPPWSPSMTPEQLHESERESFLEWRRDLAALQENSNILLTPYEKNLEFWRQLWRVVERSDIVVQIVDARNPLLFRCEDLEKYVKEVSKNKLNIILINKADFLTEKQRKTWAEYFAKSEVRVAFYSAVTVDAKPESIYGEDSDGDTSSSEFDEGKINLKDSIDDIAKQVQNLSESVSSIETKLNKILKVPAEGYKPIERSPKNPDYLCKSCVKNLMSDVFVECRHVQSELDCISDDIQTVLDSEIIQEKPFTNSSEVLSRDRLIDLFKTIHTGRKINPDLTVIGLVGYPNVGKSSTINSMLSAKKVSVSATPGKTKHFQTLYLDEDLMLCDCPGLVMPSFVFTKAEMVINGILPIDQMRDHVPPVNLVASLIPKYVIEDKYGIMLPKPMEGEDETRPPFAEELLNAYGYNRGFMTANGQPDNPRAARYILKDFVNGKLLYAHAPPGVDQATYHPFPEPKRRHTRRVLRIMPPREARAIKPNRTTTEDIDKVFFKNSAQGMHAKGIRGKSTGVPSNVTSNSVAGDLITEKPWKKINKHENKKKREKLRRVYSHLDQH